jgi:hypothetical protein
MDRITHVPHNAPTSLTTTLLLAGLNAWTASSMLDLRPLVWVFCVSWTFCNWIFGNWTFCTLGVLYLGRSATGRLEIGRFVTRRYVTGRFVGVPLKLSVEFTVILYSDDMSIKSKQFCLPELYTVYTLLVLSNCALCVQVFQTSVLVVSLTFAIIS